MTRVLPRYPIYIPSKGRSDNGLTARSLLKDGVPFRLVVEPREQAVYTRVFGAEHVLVLPWDNPGSVIPARNWIKDHSVAEGHERHWQLDDNMNGFYRWYRGIRIPCDAGIALRTVEDFADRYENLAIAGLNYDMFAVEQGAPFTLNCHVYSCTLVLNSIPYRWRGRYNEDTDICLQALAGGWCTALIHTFLVKKLRTMVLKGGNTTTLYAADGRLKMARALEKMWPGVVETKRRFKRPQHVIKGAWRKFDNKLRRKPGVVIPMEPNEYGLELKQVKTVVRSPVLRRFVTDWQNKQLPKT